MAKKTQEKYEAILNAMQYDKWYKASEFESVADVKESRVKVLLKNMTEQGMIESTVVQRGRCIGKFLNNVMHNNSEKHCSSLSF